MSPPAATSDTEPPIPPTQSRRALCWLDPGQVGLVQDVAGRASLEIVGVGAPTMDGASRIASQLDAEPFSDFRQALTSTDAALLLLGVAPDSLEAALTDASSPVRTAIARGVRIVSLEPVPTSVVEAHAWAQQRSPVPLHLAPLLRNAPGFAAAMDALESFGAVRTVSFAARCGAGQGSLAARLVDAMDAVATLLGEPEAVDAAIAGPHAASGLRLAAGDSLRQLTGDLTAHLRFPDDRAAVVVLSDQAGRWFRGVTMLGPKGCFRLDERGFEWIDLEGATVDSSGQSQSESGEDAGAARAVAEQIERLLDPRAPAPARLDLVRALALAEAALLSARTAQPESPQTILKMSGAA